MFNTKHNLWTLCLLGIIFLSGCGSTPPPTVPADLLQSSPDLVLYNGLIYTVDPEQPWAEAVAIEAGKIVYVGSSEIAQQLIGADTISKDLDGHLVLPGFHDVHLHPMEGGAGNFEWCLLSAGVEPASWHNTFQRCAAAQGNNAWVFGWGHSIEDLAYSDVSPVDILDQAIPDRPAIIMEMNSHSMWVNSLALEATGFDANTPHPTGGVLGKDNSGRLNGILYENAGEIAFELAVQQTTNAFDDDAHYDGLLSSLEMVAENGITSIVDARAYSSRNFPAVYQQVADDGLLTARTVLSLWAYPERDDESQFAELAALYRNNPESLLRMSQVKMYSDGLLQNTTAALFEPYLIDLGLTPDNRGLNYFDEARIAKWITELEPLGFDFHIHTIGSRGVHESLNAIHVARETNGELGSRHRLTHVELLRESDAERFAELNVIADMQLAGEWVLPRFHSDAEYLIGERAYHQGPIRTLYDAGAHITLSSDWDVSNVSPFLGIEQSLQRGDQSLPNIETAIAAYTINGAYLMRQEELTGSIEVGKYADLIVLDQNIFEVNVRRISSTNVLLTLLGGEEVYGVSSMSISE